MGGVRVCSLGLFVMYSALPVAAQGTYVTLAGQSKPAAVKSYNKGKLAARRDLKKGKLRIKSFGYRDNSDYCYGQILMEKYGVDLDWVGGCVVRPSLATEVSGYNSVMTRVIEMKFGKGSLGKVQTLAAECRGFQPITLDDLPNSTLPAILTFPLPSVDLPPPPLPKKGTS